MVSSAVSSEYTADEPKKDETSQQSTAPVSTGTTDFPIVKGNAEHLTAFQRKKAEYLFQANLGVSFHALSESEAHLFFS